MRVPFVADTRAVDTQRPTLFCLRKSVAFVHSATLNSTVKIQDLFRPIATASLFG